MKCFLFATLFTALSGAIAEDPSPLVIPSSYTATLQLNMPYISLTEPMKVAVSASSKQQVITYWNGMDTYITDFSGTGTSYQVIPTTEDGVNSYETCWYVPSSESDASDLPPVSLFPDFSTFSFLETRVINGVNCNGWQLVQPEYNETSGNIGTYVFYASVEDNTPVRYQFVGHNAVTGGHFDQYHFDYLDWSSGEPDASVFDVTTVNGINSVDDCVPQPAFDDDDGGGPTSKFDQTHGPTFEVPASDFSLLHPSGSSARSDHALSYFKSHGKSYDETDQVERSALYHHARRYVNAVNRQKRTFSLALNHMADWTTDEKKSLRGRRKTSSDDLSNLPLPASFTHTSVGDIPPSVDWRGTGYVTRVKDQGTCGSCWSYGVTGSLEGQVFKSTSTTVEISQQNLMDCSWPQGNNACDGGLDYNAYAWMLTSGGIASYSSYGSYLNADGFCHYTDPDVETAATIEGYANVTAYDETGDMSSLNDALANVGPISISIDASPDSFYYYAGGYYDNEECKSGVDDLDHTVLAVGYVEGPDGLYTIVKNSWSTHWGDEGYVYVKQEGNVCGVGTTPTYPILAA
ncbi:hypothetical protein TrVE_jg9641 [Triparma verrucosa]|uniref:Peptidase C1A papain C-terminal domain-containing protein n=2 Tax=Triparma TaxID=722752 RepID=A0A9W7E5E2_9STRA|nr:hypothetical protein TrST_g11813 [Triparma strigata]GMI13783.1 hypothetical protein TrVE_jg9641 [Triparma verrucosa]